MSRQAKPKRVRRYYRLGDPRKADPFDPQAARRARRPRGS